MAQIGHTMTKTTTRDRYRSLRRHARIDGPSALPDEWADVADPICVAVRTSLLTHGQHQRASQRYLDTTPSRLPMWYRCHRYPHLCGPQTAYSIFRNQRSMDALTILPPGSPMPRITFEDA